MSEINPSSFEVRLASIGDFGIQIKVKALTE
jgi:hypothetical protein